jgi:hypothetical protein
VGTSTTQHFGFHLVLREAFRVEYLLNEGCAVVTFQKLGYPFTERKNK